MAISYSLAINTLEYVSISEDEITTAHICDEGLVMTYIAYFSKINFLVWKSEPLPTLAK